MCSNKIILWYSQLLFGVLLKWIWPSLNPPWPYYNLTPNLEENPLKLFRETCHKIRKFRQANFERKTCIVKQNKCFQFLPSEISKTIKEIICLVNYKTRLGLVAFMCKIGIFLKFHQFQNLLFQMFPFCFSWIEWN